MTKEIQSNKRNYGIDALRILSMIMIVILHILGHGGVLKSLSPLSTGHCTAWILETAAYGAVNCYALISGYVGVASKFKYSGIINLIFNVVFYSLSITLIFFFVAPETVNSQIFLEAIFPFAFNTYWYFTAYFCMYFFIPFFNYLINSLNRIDAKKLILSLILILTVIPTLSQIDIAVTQKGYSTLWLSALYIFGAYIRKYNIGSNIKNLWLILIYSGCVIINLLSKFAIEYASINVFHEAKNSNFLINYCSPTVLLASVSLLMLFSKLKFGNKASKFIAFFANATFGVYLIHDFPLVRNYFISEKFVELTSFSPLIMILLVVFSAIAIWFICSITDKLRLELFKLLKVKKLCEKISQLISKLLSVFFKKIETENN